MGNSFVLTPHLVVHSTKGIPHNVRDAFFPKKKKKRELNSDVISCWKSAFFFSGIFTSFCSILGLLWESGGMAGRQQAPAGNHRHGHLGSAGRWFGDKWFFPSSICFASLPFLFPFLLCVCCGAFVCVCLSSNKLEKRKKKGKKRVHPVAPMTPSSTEKVMKPVLSGRSGNPHNLKYWSHCLLHPDPVWENHSRLALCQASCSHV